MAQQTSERWKSLWRTKNTEKEYAFDINGTWYGPESEVSHSVESGIFQELGIGNAETSKLTLKLFADNIPRGGVIKRFVRLVNGEQHSEWISKGVFFINRRSMEDNQWTIEAFDVMRKAEAVWEPEPPIKFPLSMTDAVTIFCGLMRVQLDSRTKLNDSYKLARPDNAYTIRQILKYIAAAHGGNWIVTDEGKLLLLPLISIPAETDYLVDEYGDAITFGGDRIRVR